MREFWEALSGKIFSDPDQRRALTLFMKTASMLVVLVGLLFVFVPISATIVQKRISSGGGLSLVDSASIAFCASLIAYGLLLLVEGDEVFGNYKRVFQVFCLFHVALSLLLHWVS